MKKLKSQWGKQMTKEALKMAMEALEGVLDDAPKVLDASISGGLYEVIQCRDAITAIKEALAQPEGCQCPECQIKPHTSDCAVHNEPAYPKGRCDCGAQPEQEPVAWLLTDKNINSLQVDSIQRLIDRLKHAHHTDLCVRINGQDEWFQADWLKHMVRASPPQRKPLSDEEIYSLADSLEIWNEDDEEWILDPNTFARAIEAAHGIKENT